MKTPVISMDSVKTDTQDIDTYAYDQMCGCGLIVETGTHGYKGGDWGHGGRTYFSMKWPDGCDFVTHDLEVIKDRYGKPCGFSFVAGGDWELGQLIDGLKFAVKVLEDQSKQKA